MDSTITISVSEYEELLRSQIEKETIIKMIRRDWKSDKSTCYRDCSDILEMFDYDMGDFQ